MQYQDLTAEQQEKLNDCTSADELFALAQEEGLELTDDQIEMVTGGFDLAAWIDDFANAPQM